MSLLAVVWNEGQRLDMLVEIAFSPPPSPPPPPPPSSPSSESNNKPPTLLFPTPTSTTTLPDHNRVLRLQVGRWVGRWVGELLFL